MAISPINFSRISQGLRAGLLNDAVQRSGRDLYLTQAQLASGLRFVSASEDPAGATRVIDLTHAAEQQRRFSANLRFADDTLAAADVAMSEISTLISEAHTIASQDVSNLTSADERQADAELIAAIRDQLVRIGNRQFDGRFLFAGRETTTPPFVALAGGVAYLGDVGDLVTRVPDGSSDAINVPGNVLFGALSAGVGIGADLTPSVSEETRLEDLRGATGRGIGTGILIINEQGSVGAFTVDLRQASSLGDVVEAINQAATAAGSRLTADLTDRGIQLTPGSNPVTVSDTGGGSLAADLGIRTGTATSAPIMGLDLQPRLTRLTPVSALRGGTGIDLDGGVIITAAGQTLTLDFSEAATVQDIINTLNQSGDLVRARINDGGTGIELNMVVSGASLSVGENGGTTATDLGIRTLEDQTPISYLNFGRGLGLDAGGADIRLTAKDGSTVDVDLDGAGTMEAVITAINDAATAAGVGVTASLADVGNGIRLVDATGGMGDLSLVSLGESTAAVDLGFTEVATGAGNELISADRSAVRPEGVLGALTELESALRRDDTRGITVAAERVNLALDELIRIHGTVGARSQAMQGDLQHMEDATQTAEIFLSEVRDLDYAQAATRLQTLQTQLQATFQTGANLLSLSLMDYLG